MAPRPERVALRERYDRRQAQVVSDAARVFAEHGYDQTSVPELANQLGLAAGSLYHYFTSKEDLLIAICDQLMDPLLARAQELLASPAPPEQQLRDLVRLWVAHVIVNRDHMLVFQQERHIIGSGDQWRKVRQDRKRYERLVEDLLSRLHADDKTRLRDPNLATLALLGMVNHTPQWHRRGGRLGTEAIADGYVDMILAAP
jgi:AcrR family transcriptional regulator